MSWRHREGMLWMRVSRITSALRSGSVRDVEVGKTRLWLVVSLQMHFLATPKLCESEQRTAFEKLEMLLVCCVATLAS